MKKGKTPSEQTPLLSNFPRIVYLCRGEWTSTCPCLPLSKCGVILPKNGYLVKLENSAAAMRRVVLIFWAEFFNHLGHFFFQRFWDCRTVVWTILYQFKAECTLGGIMH